MESLSKTRLTGKLGAAFGSYGWSGEAAGAISSMLKSYGMDVIEPDLRIKRIPEAECIETCKELGKVIARKLKNTL